MSADRKMVCKALLFALNVALVLATLYAFGAVGWPLVGFVVALVLSLGIGYFAGVELT